MNAIVINNNRTKLNKSQKKLYELFVDKYKKNEQVKKSELFFIYKNKVATGKTCRSVYNYDTMSYEYKMICWDEYEWQNNFRQWFIYSLGALLKKGYLSFIPVINLE